MTPNQSLIPLYAKQLRLPTIASFEPAVREAQAQGWGYEEFLCRLLIREVEHRQENQRRRRVRAAGFPLQKTMDTFDFNQTPHLEEAFVWELAKGQFVAEHHNLVLIGNPGTGKTHLAIALGLRACQEGYRVRFTTAAALVNELLEAREEKRLSRLTRQLAKADLLIADELSYLTFSRASSELLFQVISERSERGSVIVTTNLEFSRWTEIFGDPMLTAALVDRMIHQAYILNMNGDSYRLKEQRKKTAEKSTP